MMMCVHFAFVLIEMIIYSTQLTLITSELVYIYLIYFGFMTLNSVALMTYISLMFIAPVSGILFVLKIGKGISVVLFLIQLAFYGYAGGYYTLLKLRDMQIQEEKLIKSRVAKEKNHK